METNIGSMQKLFNLIIYTGKCFAKDKNSEII